MNNFTPDQLQDIARIISEQQLPYSALQQLNPLPGPCGASWPIPGRSPTYTKIWLAAKVFICLLAIGMCGCALHLNGRLETPVARVDHSSRSSVSTEAHDYTPNANSRNLGPNADN